MVSNRRMPSWPSAKTLSNDGSQTTIAIGLLELVKVLTGLALTVICSLYVPVRDLPGDNNGPGFGILDHLNLPPRSTASESKLAGLRIEEVFCIPSPGFPLLIVGSGETHFRITL